jgi:hypothetical protein
MTTVAYVLWFIAFVIALGGLIGSAAEDDPAPWIGVAVVGLLVAFVGLGLYIADADNRAAELNRKQTTCISQGYLWTQDEMCYNKDGYKVVIP